MISYLLPSRNRPDRLASTLRAIGRLSAAAHEPVGGAEVIVVDDASDPPVEVPPRLDNELPVGVVRRKSAEGAAARNAGAREAHGDWIVMLDDDSYPVDTGVIDAIADAEPDVAAIGAEIRLPDGSREQGGLPEVFVGCGAAVRRGPFLRAGGYDPSFHYYAEEYDLCAKLIRDDWRIVQDWRFRVRHEKVGDGRDVNVIVSRLVRNNGWVAQRYAPDDVREAALQEVFDRYSRIARNEGADFAYQRGLDEMMLAIDDQPRRPLSRERWDRFTGLAHARETLAAEPALAGSRVAVVDHGKNAWAVEAALAERTDCTIVEEPEADVLVIGTLSPGPMMDAWEARQSQGQSVVRPWTPAHVGAPASA